MTEQFSEETWLSVPEVAELIGVKQREVRSMLDEGALLAVRRGDNNAWMIHIGELRHSGDTCEPIPALKGTLTVLSDLAFTNQEKMDWLLEYADELGATPLEALGAGNTHAVRRLALLQV
ncbi:hypothetical protein J2S49_000247 [Arcanobacterium wilhelmae]|uniref:DNA-binding protein n=1 Tax=Arcanobacterium wilhelmae TaxID=1803177 RepID=A0ABT9N8Z2_9ACTO|nr:Rv2175c family DNA-binding protein [Arcanobacterium wilhelmae]MDP9800171.1 hypothetical protein [Arcanobacterium wilhelmae]WFN89611.1 Rv2175c family DNA-binding protein [Arcanobacterium wilhelmae]